MTQHATCPRHGALRRAALWLLPLAVAAAPPCGAASWRGGSIVAEALKTPAAFERLRVLTDMVGARLAGSAAEAQAVAWARAEFKRDGVAAHLETVTVPVWRRGEESAAIVAPVEQPLVILGLGGTVATPPRGITAPVVVVGSSEELESLEAEQVKGRIVLFDNPFARSGDELQDYRKAVRFRTRGASDAARRGAVAALIRSVGTASLRTPHTGALRYAADAPRVPAAAVTIEDAMLIRRLVEAGHEVRVRLRLSGRTGPDRPGANVVAEIRGRERPEEIVLIGAHLDSWDVGTGAIDDGAGCAMVLETMRLIAAGPPPRRTVRAVLYANEDNGLRGARAYRQAHLEELSRHVAAIEADSGAGRPVGLSLKAGDGGLAMLRELLLAALAPLGAARFLEGGGGADISVLASAGVPLLGLRLDTTRYFDWHHTMADTLDKVDPDELQQATAVLAAATWVLADWQRSLPRAAAPVEQR